VLTSPKWIGLLQVVGDPLPPAVARELHFGKAAEPLHVDPSHVSREVKALEKEFEFAVFTRANHFVAITEEAGPFIMNVEQALARFIAEFERARQLARLRARDRGHREELVEQISRSRIDLFRRG